MHNTIAYLKTCVYYSTVTQFLCPEKRKQNMCCFRSVTYLRNFICCWDEYFSMLKFPLIAGSPFYISCKCNVMSRITGLSKFCIFNFCEETALKTLLVVTWVDHLFHVRLKMVSRDHSWTVKWLGVYFPCKIAHAKLLHNLWLPIIWIIFDHCRSFQMSC